MAPETSPARLPVSITAEFEDQSASASVDILSRHVLVAGQGQVQSVTYLEGVSRLYVAELGVGGASARSPAGLSSAIVDVTEGNSQVIRPISRGH